MTLVIDLANWSRIEVTWEAVWSVNNRVGWTKKDTRKETYTAL